MPHSSELRLRRVAQGLDLLGPGYSALWLRRSGGEDEDRAREALESLLRQRPSEIHALPTGDIVALVRGFALRELSGLVAALKSRRASSDFACTIYDLTRDLSGFGAALMAALGQEAAKLATEQNAATAIQLDTPKGPLTLSKLWQRASIASCAANLAPRKISCRLALREGAYLRWVSDGLGPTGARLSRASAAAERKLLVGLVELPRGELQSFSLALTLGSLLTPEFLRFDRRLAVLGVEKPVIEFSLDDWRGEEPTAQYARKIALDQGYRLGVCGLRVRDLAQVKALDGAARVDLSFAVGDLGSKEREHRALARAVVRLGRANVVLSGVDDQRTLSWGQSAGIVLFRGRAIESAILKAG